jgi:hypothetical protein
MATRKTTKREREFELSRGEVKKKSLVIISAAIVVAAVLLAILFNTVLANHRPAIISLTAEQEEVLSSGSSQIVCHATDPDGDDLSYDWSASGGSIAGTGAVVTWVAPGEVGIYDITVLVTDSQGEEDMGSIALSVATSIPPTVEDLIVTADHKYLKETSDGYKVGKTQEFHIACIASNTSGELVYQWSCTDGQISGEGSTITWTAPDVSGEVTVTVMVTDVADNRVTKSIILDVVSCSVCTFG